MRYFIGAAVPLSEIVSSTLVNDHGQALVKACKQIGGPQVRDTATLGGNIAKVLLQEVLEAAWLRSEILKSDWLGTRLIEVYNSPGCERRPLILVGSNTKLSNRFQFTNANNGIKPPRRAKIYPPGLA